MNHEQHPPQYDNSNTWPRQRFQPGVIVDGTDDDTIPRTAQDAKSFLEAIFTIPDNHNNNNNNNNNNNHSSNHHESTNGGGVGEGNDGINVPIASSTVASSSSNDAVKIRNENHNMNMSHSNHLTSNPNGAVAAGGNNGQPRPPQSQRHVDVPSMEEVAARYSSLSLQSNNGNGNNIRSGDVVNINGQPQSIQHSQSLNFSSAPGGVMALTVNAPPGMSIQIQRPGSAIGIGSSELNDGINSNNNSALMFENPLLSGVALRRPASTGVIGQHNYSQQQQHPFGNENLGGVDPGNLHAVRSASTGPGGVYSTNSSSLSGMVAHRPAPKTLMDLIIQEETPSPRVANMNTVPMQTNHNQNQNTEGVYRHFEQGPAPTVNGTRIQYVSSNGHAIQNDIQIPHHHHVPQKEPQVQQQQPQLHPQFVATGGSAPYPMYAPNINVQPYSYYDPKMNHHPTQLAGSNISYVNAQQQPYYAVPFTSAGHHPQSVFAMAGPHGHPVSVVAVSQQNGSQALPYWPDPIQNHHGQQPVQLSHSLSSESLQGQGGGKHKNNRNNMGQSSARGGKRNNGKRGENNKKFIPSNSAILDEFRSVKNRQWVIYDIKGHVVEFCKDQNGSRFIQQRLEVADTVEKDIVMAEVTPQMKELRDDVFGNYVIQKLFEHGTDQIKDDLAKTLQGEMRPLSLQMYGCRVVQKALETLDDETVFRLIHEFEGSVVGCIHDQNGNHVIQKCVETLSLKAKRGNRAAGEKLEFVLAEVLENTGSLSCHPYGCRVMQRVLEHCPTNQRCIALDEIRKCQHELLDDQYGNYVVQHVLQFGRDNDRESILKLVVEGGLLTLSRQKFASNVVEKLLKFGSPDQRNRVVREMLEKSVVDGETSVVLLMVRDAYANYVVQTTLDVISDGPEKVQLLQELNDHADQLRNYTFAKHIVTKLSTP